MNGYIVDVVFFLLVVVRVASFKLFLIIWCG